MQKILYTIFLFVSFVSCHDSISVPQEKDKCTLVVYAFPTVGDSIEIRVSATSKQQPLSITNVFCTTNGKHDRIFTSEAGFDFATFFAIGCHKAGDEISINISDETLPAVSATTHIPYSVNIDDVKISTTLYKGNTYKQLRLSFTDNKKAMYYATRLIGKYENEDNLVNTKYEFSELETSAEPILNNYSSVEMELGAWNNYYHKMYIFNDSSFGNKQVNIHLLTLKKGWICAYKTQLFVLSPEFYSMLKSINDINNNDLGTNGLSFMFSSYTNVNGGYGCVAGYSMNETTWMK